ncbi:MAG: hypothetical protein HZT40_05435 [Candidatus Thiothrix singaporensis]|uniref:Uncharacterized protein n=1 Tax=Candidatus Thiothrix singaporensis TaxID=2799669 RepID=A0A7L6APY5_9GAMM|nr:MAG: hypothetical protein HZT40_05435 [Candidatus Thiothrix singaporensis]
METSPCGCPANEKSKVTCKWTPFCSVCCSPCQMTALSPANTAVTALQVLIGESKLCPPEQPAKMPATVTANNLRIHFLPCASPCRKPGNAL